MEGGEGNGIRDTARQILLRDVLAAIAPDQYKVLVLDDQTLPMVTATLDLNELLDRNIAVIQHMSMSRQPYIHMEAIYLITPTVDSVSKLLQDFAGNVGNFRGKMYAKAHIVFTSSLKNGLFHRIKSSTAARHVESMREVYLDWVALEERAFLLEDGDVLHGIYDMTVPRPDRINQCLSLSKHIADFIISQGDMPRIVFAGQHKRDIVTTKLASLTHQHLVNGRGHCRGFPADDAETRPRPTLLIIDRSMDMVGPLLHEFTYQAMAFDLLDSDPDQSKCRFKVDSGAGEEHKEITLGPFHDSLWRSFRHAHIADCSRLISKQFEDFIRSFPQAEAMGKPGCKRGLEEIKEALTQLPEFQKMKDKVALHINLAAACTKCYNERFLDKVSELEQDLATGFTSDGEQVMRVEDRMSAILANPSIRASDKKRLLLVYALREGQEKTRALLESTSSPQAESLDIDLALRGMSRMTRLGPGVETYESFTKPRKVLSNTMNTSTIDYELSRFQPPLKSIVEQVILDQLDSNQFASFDGDSNRSTERKLKPRPRNQPVHRSSKLRPTWNVRQLATSKSASYDSYRSNGRVIVFVVGGLTFGELRSIYEVSDAHQIDVIVGSTHLLTPERFVASMERLGRTCQAVGPDDMLFDQYSISSGAPQSTGLTRFLPWIYGTGVPATKA